MASTFNPKDEYRMGKGQGDTEFQILQKVGQSTGGRNPVQESRYQELLRQQPQASGSSVTSSPASNVGGTYSTGGTYPGTSNLGGQGQSMSDFSTAYQNYVQNQPKYQDLWKSIAGTFNYPQLATTATNLQNQLAMIPQTYGSAAQGGMDVTGNQLDRIYNTEAWKLAPLAQRATAQAQTAGQLTGEQLAAAVQQQMKELMPWQTNAQTLQAILGNLTNILGAQIGQQFKVTPQGTLISTGATPGSQPFAYNPFVPVQYSQGTQIT